MYIPQLMTSKEMTSINLAKFTNNDFSTFYMRSTSIFSTSLYMSQLHLKYLRISYLVKRGAALLESDQKLPLVYRPLAQTLRLQEGQRKKTHTPELD